MENKSYYRILSDIDNDFAVTDSPFVVNCTGYHCFSEEVRVASLRRDYYLLYLVRGSLEIQRPHTGRLMRAGELFVFPPEEPFAYAKPEGEPFEYYWMHFSGSHAAELLQKCSITPGRIVTPGNHEGLCEAFRSLFRAFLRRDTFFTLEAAAKGQILLVRTGRYLSGPSTDAPRDFSRVSRALNVIHDDLSAPVSVQDLADAEHMSVSYFRKLFREVTGMSPQEYIIFSRLNYACELLRQTDFPLRVISASVGYEDPQYFIRLFGRRLGLSPGQYRISSRRDTPAKHNPGREKLL